jgi:hypothetical protein
LTAESICAGAYAADGAETASAATAAKAVPIIR